jgi:hypothetical protein
MKDFIGVWLNIGILVSVIIVSCNLKEVSWLMNHIFISGVDMSGIYSHYLFKFDLHIAVYCARLIKFESK